jgi:hypothetical protein
MAPLPGELHYLFTAGTPQAEWFRQHVCQYNTALAFTSLEVKVDSSVNEGGGGLPTFRIHDELCHRLGFLFLHQGNSEMKHFTRSLWSVYKISSPHITAGRTTSSTLRRYSRITIVKIFQFNSQQITIAIGAAGTSRLPTKLQSLSMAMGPSLMADGISSFTVETALFAESVTGPQCTNASSIPFFSMGKMGIATTFKCHLRRRVDSHQRITSLIESSSGRTNSPCSL